MKVFLVLLLGCLCNAQDYAFPEGFTFGLTSASHSIEGAWNISKGENIFDRLAHTNPCHMLDCSTGDVAANAYYKTEEDVQLLADIGVNHYRFSLSWSRILPTGHINVVNEEGVAYYNGLIDALVAQGITPIVTIYHWDLPQSLLELGGWPNPLLADYYVDYADLVFELFGDRVQNWITFNEPHMFSAYGYSYGALAPTYNQDGIGAYLCSYTILMAHARAYRLYQEKYKSTQGGRIGMTFDAISCAPEDPDNADDVEAATIYMTMAIGLYAHPIYTAEGNYPSVMVEGIANYSIEEGFPRSRLPVLTEEEIDLIRGTADFFGLNNIEYQICRKLHENDTIVVAVPSHGKDLGVSCHEQEDLDRLAPWGLRTLLNFVKDTYENPEIMITENGYGDSTGTVDDCNRINYINQYLESLLVTINEDAVNVTGYSVRSFLDGFEWTAGHTIKFGMVNVDFDDDDRPRTRKMSSYVYENIIETGAVDWTYTPDGFEACDFSTL